jgi:hypothetical protein
MHSGNPLFYPLNWLFTNTFWKTYMKRVLENVRKMAEGNEPYIYMNNIDIFSESTLALDFITNYQ